MSKLDFTGYEVPAHTQGALERYVEHGLEPGGFLTAVLANDLVNAVSRADEANSMYLKDIVQFIYNRLPMGIYGSYDKVREYCEQKRG